MSEYLKRYKQRHKDYFNRNRAYIKKSNWHTKDLKDFDTKYENFKSENSVVDNIVRRLSAFIKGAEGDRHLKSIQNYIDEIVEVINLHLKKVENYLEKNVPDEKYKHQDKLQSEIKFQDFIFTEVIKIQEQLDKLNINNDSDSLEIKFFNNKKASLILKETLSERNIDIKQVVENLQVDWNVSNSKEMLVNMNPKDIPPWNPKKHFWEQDLSTIQFWEEERTKTKKGLNINGYKIHPWLYWHLNVFKTPIPQEDGTRPTIHPYLRDNEYFFIENVKDAEEKGDKGLLLWGTRRWTKSTIIGSYTDWKLHTNFNSIAQVTGGSEPDLNSLTDMIKSSIDFRHPAFKLDVLSSNWNSGDTLFGIKESASEAITFSTLKVKNLAAGAKTSTQKTAGGYASAFVTDEIGKFSWLKSYLAALPAFRTPYGFAVLPILCGTAGEEDLSEDAFKVLSDPEKYNMLLMNWDLLEKGIDPEHITWQRSIFATFLPGQMSYLYPKKEKKLSEFLNIDNKDLEKINIQVTDWKKAKESILKEREEAKGDSLLLQQKTVQTPIKPEDSMMSAKNNPYKPEEAKKQRNRLVSEGDNITGTGIPIELERDKNNPSIIKYTLSHKEVAKFPHKGGGFIDAPFILYDEFPQFTPPRFRFCAGLDDYRHQESNGDSIGAFYIFDRLKRKIVLSLATRPDPHPDLHYQIHMALDAYNAVCFPENEDMDIKKYFDRLHLTDIYLGGSFDVMGKLGLHNTGNRKYGWQPGKNTRTVLGLVKDLISEQTDIKDEQGNIIATELGIDKIEDIHLLDEFINYREGGNFDRIIALGSALLYDFFLTASYIVPSNLEQQKNQEERKKKEKNTPPRNKLFANKKRRAF